MQGPLVKVSLDRTFSKFDQVPDPSKEGLDPSFQLAAQGTGRLSWDDLLKKRMVVILGEAGIGKTYEFRFQAEKLREQTKNAFFLELNRLDSRDSLAIALGEMNPLYADWLDTDVPGYFFLDAIDEARLKSTPDLRKAFGLLIDVLRSHLSRVSFYVSSRVTDWSLPDVRQVVEHSLFVALRESSLWQETEPRSVAEVGDISLSKTPSSLELEVFCLNPLSEQDAKKLAEAYGANPVQPFWEAIAEGGHRFLATRPLDLEWLVRLWTAKRKLGTYLELIEEAVTQRLSERNQSYVDSKVVLSPERLRKGAEQIAASCIFSGRYFVLVGSTLLDDGCVLPAQVLPDWQPDESFRLLGAAIFDEATYGRVMFHHRAVREYLAACWVERRLTEGFPIQDALELFIQSPYGEPVLLTGRRAVLCWLVSLDSTIRGRIIKLFPEMLMFEGDPERWSSADVEEAFEGYLRKLQSGFQQNWWNDWSEMRRVARVLVSILPEYLRTYSKKPEVLYHLLHFVKIGKLHNCAGEVYSIYRDPDTNEDLKQLLLRSLVEVASPEQRAAITEDLVLGRLLNDEMVAVALQVAVFQDLSTEWLSDMFRRAKPESDYGLGPISTAIRELLPALDASQTVKLLEALLKILSTSSTDKLRHGEHTWLITLLAYPLLHYVQAMCEDVRDYPQVITDAILLLERLHDYSHVSREAITGLRAEIEKRPAFRRHIACAIATATDIGHNLTGLWLRPCMVEFRCDELPWLATQANRSDLPKIERDAWYEITRDIAFCKTRGKRRQAVLRSLIAGPDSGPRSDDIRLVREKRIEAYGQTRKYTHEEHQRIAKNRKQLQTSKAALLSNIGKIRNGVDAAAILWLTQYIAQHSGFQHLNKLNADSISRDLDGRLADAYVEGMKHVWKNIEIPNPSDYPEDKLPWLGILGYASINHAMSQGQAINSMLPDEVNRAVRYCVWREGEVPPWLEDLVAVWPEKAKLALDPWFDHELTTASVDHRGLRTIHLVFDGPNCLRLPFLKQIVTMMHGGRVLDATIAVKAFEAMADSGMDCTGRIADYAIKHLLGAAAMQPRIFAPEWFRVWAKADFPSAWHWIEENSAILAKDSLELAEQIVRALFDTAWARPMTGNMAEISALDALFQFLGKVIIDAGIDVSEDRNSLEFRSIPRMRDSIPRILANMPGKDAQIQLRTLAEQNAGTALGNWITRLIGEHASAEAEVRAIISPTEIPRLGEVYLREPKTEGELFSQVVARLKEIRVGVENGPFSDRVLFEPGIEEKKLQVWLAARLDDTPRRRFTTRYAVHREPQVDEGNRTDIEVSSAAGKVCIEIKPVDTKRAYSASSLVKTLNCQLAGQYLRGRNSRHGVLVIFRLEKKKWKVPGLSGLRDFSDLLEYLREQAELVRMSNPDVDGLSILGFDCIAPGGHLKFPHPWPGQNPPPRAATGRLHPNLGRSC